MPSDKKTPKPVVNKKPSPKVLGSGGARKAAEALIARDKRMRNI